MLRSVLPIRVGRNVTLFQEGNQWKVSINIRAESEDAAIRNARKVGEDKLTLLEVFLAGWSTGFKIAIPEGSGCNVKNMSTGRTNTRSNTVVITVAGLSASVSVMRQTTLTMPLRLLELSIRRQQTKTTA